MQPCLFDYFFPAHALIEWIYERNNLMPTAHEITSISGKIVMVSEIIFLDTCVLSKLVRHNLFILSGQMESNV